ncbi:hypothetical protein AQJ46_20225 [Streptomyces canus]|uniref:Uncharacterized protein n=1 Tax=Streptomyces canus TaxID=58343 RepID=A0A101S7R9_9ACTN|nr:hypothetical protein AQJ46_20225 [Streptomyces canus]
MVGGPGLSLDGVMDRRGRRRGLLWGSRVWGAVVDGPALRQDPMMDRPGRRRDMVWISGTWGPGSVVGGPGRA